MMFLADLSIGNWLMVGLIGVVCVVGIFLPGIIALVKMNTTQHVHRQKLNNDDRRIEWCEEGLVNASESRNKMKQNQVIVDKKVTWLCRKDENYETNFFDAIDAEPEKPIIPLPKSELS